MIKDKVIKYLVEIEDINTWEGKSGSNSIKISQINVNEYFVEIKDKKGVSFKTALLDTIEKAMEFVNKVLKDVVKWSKKKRKEIQKTMVPKKKRIKNLLLMR